MPFVEDLTEDSPQRVIAICRALVACGGVLHGSNVKPMLQVIEPRQANDAAKTSGNRCAVYASDSAEVALWHAVVNRSNLVSRLNSYTIGYRVVSGGIGFRATENVRALFRQRDPAVLSDGFVYVLDETRFTRLNDSACEFASSASQTPLRTLRVAASLGWYLTEGALLGAYGDNELVTPSRAPHVTGRTRRSS